MNDKLNKTLEPFDRLKISFKKYSSDFVRDPALASSQYSNEDLISHEMVCINTPHGLVGNLSFYINKNDQKRDGRYYYARIDIVVTINSYRGMGIAHLLNLLTINYLLENYGDKLYSISCLAAHQAIEKSLEKCGFNKQKNENEDFTRMSFDIDLNNVQTIIHNMKEVLQEHIRAVNYHLHRKETSHD